MPPSAGVRQESACSGSDEPGLGAWLAGCTLTASSALLPALAAKVAAAWGGGASTCKGLLSSGFPCCCDFSSLAPGWVPELLRALQL